VIVATGPQSHRPPPAKGSLVDLRAERDGPPDGRPPPWPRLPELPVDEFEDLYLGVAHQVGEQAPENMARRVAVLLGRGRPCPEATVSRACASSLLCVAMAANGIVAAGAGGGVPCRRYRVGLRATPRRLARRTAAPDIPSAPESSPEARAAGLDRSARAGRGPRNVYLDMGQTAENVADRYGISRFDQDTFALRSQQRYTPPRTGGGVLGRRDHSAGAAREQAVRPRRLAPAGHDRGSPSPSQAGVPRTAGVRYQRATPAR